MCTPDTDREYNETVKFIRDIPKFAEKHSPDVTRGYLHTLQDPDLCAPIVHVAGTNGKGSVCNYLASILSCAGYRTALFTSPHLVDIRERMRIDGNMIPKAGFVRLCGKVKRLCTPLPTFFEFLFLVAMLWFREQKPDVIVLEVGLGGRLDATNSVSHTAVSVITRIGLDHMQYLGNTAAAIAGEKAGILRGGTPAVFLDTPDEAYRVIQRRAKTVGAPFSVVRHSDYHGSLCGDSVLLSCHEDGFEDLSVQLHSPALYQAENASLAIAAARLLDGQGFRVPEKSIREGICKAVWPGRMESIAPRFYVDGGHNDDGIHAFLASVSAMAAAEQGGHRVLLFSAVRDKQYGKELRAIAASGLFGEIVTAPLEDPRGASGGELQGAVRSALAVVRGKAAADLTGDSTILYDTDELPEVTQYACVRDAAAALMERLRSEPQTIVFAAGSLYLAGELERYRQDFIHDQF